MLSLGEGEIDRRKEDGVKYGTTNQGTWTFYLNFGYLGCERGDHVVAPPPLGRRMEGPWEREKLWWDHAWGGSTKWEGGTGGRPRLQVRTLPTH